MVYLVMNVNNSYRKEVVRLHLFLIILKHTQSFQQFLELHPLYLIYSHFILVGNFGLKKLESMNMNIFATGNRAMFIHQTVLITISQMSNTSQYDPSAFKAHSQTFYRNHASWEGNPKMQCYTLLVKKWAHKIGKLQEPPTRNIPRLIKCLVNSLYR